MLHMLTFNLLGKHGNLGNQLFQIASCIGFSKRYNISIGFPKWSYNDYFSNQLPIYNGLFNFQVEEKYFKGEWGQWDSESDLYNDFDVSIKGWLQSSLYWQHCKEDVQKVFELKPEFVNWVITKYKNVFSKQTIAISIRRSDYVGNPNYELLPIRYYLGALLKYFPDFRDNYNILLFSDDIEYCKIHFGCLRNAYFIEGSPMEQHALMRQCDNFVLANSTFSYWGAYLAKNANLIICPKYLFSGKLLRENGQVTFFEKDWEVFDHKAFKIDLSDTTFLIPCYHDSKDREENINLVVKTLKEDFNCKIIVGENKTSSFSHLGDKYVRFEYEKFHRTRMLNQMAQKALTPIIVNYDADVLTPPLQLLEAVRLARSGFDMVYPYDGRFARVSRINYKDLDILKDVGILTEDYRGTNSWDEKSVGGAIVFYRDSFFEGGGENEKFISYGPEDKERAERFSKIGFEISRIHGIIYHLDHVITTNSSMQHEDYSKNVKYYEKISKLTKEELLDYIDTWNFGYSDNYQEEIFDNTSPGEVYPVLKELIEFETIVDAGCGNGSWQFKWDYTGIDYNIVSPAIDYFIQADLRKYLPDIGKWDLCLCLEVAEHIDKRFEDVLINNLCKLSDQILFSAAIPGQGGENHVNEQWQEYWTKKFKQKGYFPYKTDIRKLLWNNPSIAVYYKQNMILYTKIDYGADYELNVVHPDMYKNLILA